MDLDSESYGVSDLLWIRIGILIGIRAWPLDTDLNWKRHAGLDQDLYIDFDANVDLSLDLDWELDLDWYVDLGSGTGSAI